MNLEGATLAEVSNRRRLIIRIGGHEKNGRTTFGLTAPGPLAFFNLNNRAEHVLDKFVKEKEIWEYRYNLRIAVNKEHWKEQWDKFQDNFYSAVSHPDIRSLVIDTETDVWEIRRLAEFGRESNIPTKYVPLNKDMRNIFEAINESDKNLVVISEMKKQYSSYIDHNGKEIATWDGKTYAMAGWNNVGYKVQVNLEAGFNMVDKKPEFTATVINCGLDPSLTNYTYAGDECNFTTLAKDIFDDWKEE